jgi:hypothetical protein
VIGDVDAMGASSVSLCGVSASFTAASVWSMATGICATSAALDFSCMNLLRTSRLPAGAWGVEAHPERMAATEVATRNPAVR